MALEETNGALSSELMTTINRFSLVLLFVFVSLFQIMGQSTPRTSYEEYIANIRGIYASVGDLTSELDLKDNVQFEELSSQPLIYAEYALAALGDSRLSEDEKLVALLSTYRLSDVTRYTGFVNNIFQLWTDGQVSKAILMRAIFPGYDWNRAIVDDYKDPNVVLLLDRISTADHLDREDRILMDNILSGLFSEKKNPRLNQR